jgi:hypothetical protein
MTSTRLPPPLSPHDTSITTPLHALHRIRPHYIPFYYFVLLARFVSSSHPQHLESKLRSPLAMYYLHPVTLSAHHWHDNTSLGELASHPTLRTSNLLTLIQPSLSASLNHRIAAQSLIAVNLCICIDTPESIFCLCLGNDVEAFILINSRAYFKVQGTYFWT